MEERFLSPQDLVNNLPINHGDTILLASNVERLLWNAIHNDQVFDFNQLLTALQEKIGKDGNLLLPVYNWDFCRGITWDYHRTQSKTGTLSQFALKRKDFIRTHHAIYSFAVWGKDAQRLFNMNDVNSFVGDTPFDFLYRTPRSKMVAIDVNLTNCFTFVHYVEETYNVPYRFLKKFTGDYIDEHGKKDTRTYSMYVRYLDRTVITDFSGLESNLLSTGKMIKKTVDDVVIRSLTFQDAYDKVAADIKCGDYSNIVKLD